MKSRSQPAPIYILLILLFVCTINAASETTDEHLDRARELLSAGSHEEAAEEFRMVAKLAPDGSKMEQTARYWVGQCYFRMKQFDEALSTFEKIIEEYPESALVSVTRAMMDRVKQEKENEKFKARMGKTSDKGVIVDPKTGLKFTKVYSDEKLNLISHNLGLIISPDGRFLFGHHEKLAIPLKEGEEPFSLAPDIIATAYGSWSPDMSKFAFITRQTGDLFIVPLSPETGRPTGPAKKLIEDTGDGREYPSWSPDGKRIAFSWRKNGNFDIWTIPAAGGEPTQITDDPRREGLPVWSPDGKSIVFGRERDLTRSRTYDVWIVPAEGGTAEKILENAVAKKGSSSDGRLFAFQREGVEGVGILRLSDRRQFNITPPEEVVGRFSYGPKVTWSPKASKLLFYNSGFEYWSTLGVVSIYGAPVELAEGVRLNACAQEWSPDGKSILTLDWKTNDLWIVPTDGGTPARLKVEIEPEIWRYALQPFSPDLKKLAFVTKDGSLWVLPISVEERRVTGPAAKVAEDIAGSRTTDIGWSPDSNWTVFSSTVSGNADIWTASADGSELKQLTDDPKDESISGWFDGSAWSPDGEMIVYTKSNALWVVPASGGEPRELVKDAMEPAWSPDGKELGFMRRDCSSVSIVTLTTGEVSDIVDLKASGMVDPKEPTSQCWGLTWSPDGKWLSFFTARRGACDFWLVPAEGGKARELAGSYPSKWYAFWSPDGKKLSYNSDRDVRVRIGAIWEVDVEELLSREE